MGTWLLALCLLLVGARGINAAASGDFTSAVMIHNGTTSRHLSLANGHLLLSETAAGLCGYTPATFGTQRKLVLAYWAALEQGPLAFSLCNSGPFMQNLWLLTCPRPLAARDGADAGAEGCRCQLPSSGHHACATGPYGFHVTVDAQPGYWYYLVVQANPPETGEDGERRFTVTTALPDSAAHAAAAAYPPEPETSVHLSAGGNDSHDCQGAVVAGVVGAFSAHGSEL